MLAAAAATGLLSVTGGAAYADAGAAGAATNSPGVASGNAVQAPVHVPVNLCGNTVNVIALLNPAFGNACANTGDGGAQAEAAATDSPGVASGNAVQAPVHVPVNVCGNSANVVGLLNPVFGNECVNGGAQPPTEEPPTEQPPTEEPPTEEPPTEEPPTEEPPTEEPPTEEPPTEQPPTQEPPTEEPPTEEPPAEEPPADEPPADEPPTGRDKPKDELARTGADQIGAAAALSAALLGGGLLMVRRGNAARR
ncbi:chaplin [Streptomyces sp. NPDC058374]|uniref:chaplin n=1 Tax=unclassified Streptomyces TaxID=2593676 RepID=UPI00365921CC